MLWEWAMLILLSELMAVFIVCIWATFFFVVLLPRIIKDVGGEKPARSRPASNPGSWDELRLWVKQQPSKTIYKADVEGYMAVLERQDGKGGNSSTEDTQLVPIVRER